MISFATFPSVPAPVARSPMWSTNYLLFRISKIKAKEETKIWERKDHLWLEQSISVDIRYHLGEKSAAQTRQSTEWGQKKWAMFTGCRSRQQAKLMTWRPASDSDFIKWIQSDLCGLFLGLLVSLLSLCLPLPPSLERNLKAPVMISLSFNVPDDLLVYRVSPALTLQCFVSSLYSNPLCWASL